MKILFDASSMALSGYHRGGVYMYGLRLLQELPAALGPEDELALYFNFVRGHHLDGARDFVERSGVGAHRICRLPPQLLRKLKVPVEWTGGRHDVFHGPADLLPARSRGARVVTIHDLAFLRAPEGLPTDWLAERAATVPPAARSADMVVTVSEFSRRDIVDKLGVPEECTAVVYHGISEGLAPLADPDAADARLKNRYGIDPGFLLYLGTMQPNKNIEGLCEAYQLLRGRGFEAPLVLAGAQGWLFDEMWARIVARGHDQGVLRTGFVDQEDIPLLYGRCAAFALVSFLEGFGIPVIEAMACGAPVVAADACSLTEVTADAGLLVDPHDPGAIADALERAATPGPEREDLVRRGLAHAATFTWSQTAAGHVAAYRRAQELAS
jgi:glycosyltransferase involved in cell wall biosynthesis